MTRSGGPRVESVVLTAAGSRLSGLIARPAGRPRATVLALHGIGMQAAYFHRGAHPALSLLSIGAREGFTVIAVDRPGYGASAPDFPSGCSLPEQAGFVRSALDAYGRENDLGAGVFVIGHSFGGALALHLASDPALLGVDVSGCGLRPAGDLPIAFRNGLSLAWGPLGLYPPGTFARHADLTTIAPDCEIDDITRWPGQFRQVAAAVRCPVRMSFAEHERFWGHGETDLAQLAELFPPVARLRVDRITGSGHNVSLSLSATDYHLSVINFAAACAGAAV